MDAAITVLLELRTRHRRLNRLLLQGDELNRVDVLADPSRLLCTAESTGEVTNAAGWLASQCLSLAVLPKVLFETEFYANLSYEKPSENFHQWTGSRR
jgi:hypothetical protein